MGKKCSGFSFVLFFHMGHHLRWWSGVSLLLIALQEETAWKSFVWMTRAYHLPIRIHGLWFAVVVPLFFPVWTHPTMIWCKQSLHALTRPLFGTAKNCLPVKSKFIYQTISIMIVITFSKLHWNQCDDSIIRFRLLNLFFIIGIRNCIENRVKLKISSNQIYS